MRRGEHVFGGANHGFAASEGGLTVGGVYGFHGGRDLGRPGEIRAAEAQTAVLGCGAEPDDGKLARVYAVPADLHGPRDRALFRRQALPSSDRRPGPGRSPSRAPDRRSSLATR